MADALDWLRQMLGGGQDAQPGADALGQLQSRLAAEDQVQTPPQTWPWDLSKLTGMPSALEQSAAATAANPWQPGMTAGQVLAGRPEDPLAGAFQPGVGVGAIRAYHGSPYDFERFDLSKIGTGEGAQAYGHGLYFAENEGVAKGYRDTLVGRNSNATDRLLEDNSGKIPMWAANQIEQYPVGHEYHGGVIDKLTSMFKDRIAEQDDLWKMQPWIAKDNKQGLQEIVDNLARLKSGDVRFAPKPTGRMYEAQINAEPEQFLDWDKPLSQQSQQVQDAIKQHRGMAGFFEQNPNATGEQLYRYKTNPTGGGFPEKAGAAETMKAFGIPGIRYLDQGSRGAGQGTSNYAVFDDKLIEILRKYGILPPLAGAGLLGASQGEPPT